MQTTVFAAVQIKRFINDIGDYVGFASIVAVAILILLYFSHARETASLRERLDQAQGRIAGLEARIGQLIHAQASAQRGRQPAPVQPAPVPSPVRPMGSAIASVRRVPAAATAAAGAGAAAAATATLAPPAVASPAVANGLPPAAPVGVGAPALASATKLIPDPPRPVRPADTPDDTMFVPAAAAATAAAANGQGDPATRALPAVAAASARNPSITARPASGGDRPPRVKIGAETDAPAPPRRTIPSSRAKSRATRGGGTILPAEDDSGRLSGRLLPLVIAGVAVIVIIVGLILITTSGGGSTSANVPHGSTGPGSSATTGQNLSHHHAKAPIFKPASVRVSVLNGTAVANLAADVGNKLASAGYKQGNITNAATQTEPSTIVYYLPGPTAKVSKTAAQHVAVQLKLPASRVRPATQAAIKSCSTSVTGTPGTSCDADVIVSVGTDRADLASGNGG
jgi:LytR cell envelope-related transcriptional attenuator